MACRSRVADRAAFSVVEAVIGLAVGAMLLAFVYGGLSTVLKLLARGESKLNTTAQSELLFRRLAADLAGALKPAAIAADRTEIELVTSGSPLVRWTFRPTKDGRGSVIERTTPGEAASTFRYMIGALTNAVLNADDAGGRHTLSVKLAARGTHDAGNTDYSETYFLRSEHADPDWNSLSRNDTVRNN